MHWRQKLRTKTHDPRFLWRMVIGVLAVGGLLGLLVQWLPRVDPLDLRSKIELLAQGGSASELSDVLVDAMRDPAVDWGSVLDVLPAVARLATLQPRLVPQVAKSLEQAPPGPPTTKIGVELWRSLTGDAVTPELERLAAARPPVRYANRAAATFWSTREDWSAAARYYSAEGDLPEADTSRRRVVQIYLQHRAFDRLEALRDEPQFRDAIAPRVWFEMAIQQRNWWDAWWRAGRLLGTHTAWGPVLLAITGGSFWFLFCWHLVYEPKQMRARTILCCTAVALGILSVWPTLFVEGWQRVVWGMEPSEELVPGLRYFIAGVGLREELCKLACLLPLIPILVHRGHPLECLVVCTCVGVGFAVAENVSYFGATYGTAAIGRFLTANFFHMSLTGLIGLALCRAIWYPAEGWPHFLMTFIGLVFLHGLYDALLVLPDLSDYSMGALIVYILLSYQYFREVRSLRSARGELVSLTANLLLGVSCVTAATFIYLCFYMDWSLALGVVGAEALSLATMVYMFLRELPDSMVTV